ncbi:MAG: DUF6157 family protein [Planctomycetota bacterium]
METYISTLIRTAPDCPVESAVVPVGQRGKKSIPQIEYELLAAQPYFYTQPELLFATHVQRLELGPDELAARQTELWDEFFSRSRACLRASMLPKKYGWGLHFDAAGRIGLVAMESPQYRAFNKQAGLKTLLAMRNSRG